MAEFEALVGQFMDVTSFREDAIVRKALKDNNNNLEFITDQYFNDPENFVRRYELKWDNTPWVANREGEPTNTHIIHAEDTIGSSEVIYGTEPPVPYAGLAPSRPPSRSDNRSPLSQVVDLQTTGYNMTGAPTTQQEEDDALARAIQMSMNESHEGGLPDAAFVPLQQESGVVGAFGPANKDESAYATGEWAMVTASHYLQGTPDPSSRVRKPEDKVFLRAKEPSTHRLGALLMIYHEIPAARNALLETARGDVTTYGVHKTWWDGSPIVPEGHQVPIWEDEICRLMAFLDMSNRSYGTINTLAGDTSTRRSLMGSAPGFHDDPEKEFFHQLAKELENRNIPDKTFISDVEVINYETTSVQGPDRFGILELSYPKDAGPHNLYNIWDLIFYADLHQTAQTPSDGRMAWISKPSDVVTCRIQYGDKLHNKVEIPEVFYLDRYLRSSSEQILEIQEDMIKAYRANEDYKQRDYQILNWTNSAGVSFDREQLLKQALEKMEIKARRIISSVYWKQHMAARAQGGPVPEYLPARHEDLEPHHDWNEGQANLSPHEQAAVDYLELQIQDLKTQLDKVTKFKEEAKQRRNALEALFTKLRYYLTDPQPEDDQWRPDHEYRLCGVVNKANTVYLRALVEGEDSASPAFGWRKISYDNINIHNRGVVNQEWVTFEEVIKDSCGPSTSPILVYATEEAFSAAPISLDAKQKMFVKTDNKLFQQELSEEAGAGRGGDDSGMAEQQSGGLHKSSSMDSLATNKASAGSVDGDQEMTDVELPAGGQEMQQVPGVPIITITPDTTMTTAATTTTTGGRHPLPSQSTY
ncbi:hypothetical protein QBC44DRAFT_33588 [Cladorrhinum sp. PSN332]|nr:hypothetical protein QBC44DRAFT_33588 [Cladorrhinum sp. PSN332]